jgi:membrane protein YdbS with pleckstrin-like domain
VSDVRPEPDGRLAPAARLLWSLELLSAGLVASVVALVAGRVLRRHDGAAHAIGLVAPWVVVALAVAAVVALPSLRLARWRWRLDDEELDLRRGIVTDVRTIVPVARIQHVDIRRSLFAQLAGVAAVVVHTAAGTTDIPALTERDAATVRDRLAGLIRTPDDE